MALVTKSHFCHTSAYSPLLAFQPRNSRRVQGSIHTANRLLPFLSLLILFPPSLISFKHAGPCCSGTWQVCSCLKGTCCSLCLDCSLPTYLQDRLPPFFQISSQRIIPTPVNKIAIHPLPPHCSLSLTPCFVWFPIIWHALHIPVYELIVFHTSVEARTSEPSALSPTFRK